MESTAHRAASCEGHVTGASWRAVAEVLTDELAAGRHRLAAVERMLRPPAPPAMPARCHRCPGLAAQGASSPDGAPPPGFEPPPGPATGLSRREAEVLRLLAAGESNRAIARALFLSPRTVQRHVANIYLKIGAHCRAEATVYALQHGLA